MRSGWVVEMNESCSTIWFGIYMHICLYHVALSGGKAETEGDIISSSTVMVIAQVDR